MRRLCVQLLTQSVEGREGLLLALLYCSPSCPQYQLNFIMCLGVARGSGLPERAAADAERGGARGAAPGAAAFLSIMSSVTT